MLAKTFRLACSGVSSSTELTGDHIVALVRIYGLDVNTGDVVMCKSSCAKNSEEIVPNRTTVWMKLFGQTNMFAKLECTTTQPFVPVIGDGRLDQTDRIYAWTNIWRNYAVRLKIDKVSMVNVSQLDHLFPCDVLYAIVESGGNTFRLVLDYSHMNHHVDYGVVMKCFEKYLQDQETVLCYVRPHRITCHMGLIEKKKVLFLYG